ncbi:NADH-FMN oxidoreductase RutF, flavin reductase (DIM6/NTAB) family [Streptomyces sp. Ag82_O1-12]|uniref:flavin reductase family protein n=1 Tax=unclassified Streptomyces TaxID=2593676 RepID=UPI000BC3E9D1|nr:MULTISPECIES: flavin reductase family protein [unclassified Streptomyces]SMQ13930.1 NADH-FMN oxidoreductase RutF, flavin reductase (DIM6/NTAB) family [Streptomyces sp. Ag82_O1-12]SOD42959.1 NADH-FMN oxidoreductase RutF, flavin reductase (DIM6/NTAB) family [Streptomyces sp. Ag82_G6-1]
MTSRTHLVIRPSILYFGTPVVLLTTENADGTCNLAPISSAWALGQHLVLGLGSESHTVRNLAERPELVINVASPELWEHVERLAPLTGADPVPEAKQPVYRHERDKFAAAGLTPAASDLVRPPRVAECALQLEARARALTPGGAGLFVTVECEVLRVHAAERVVVPGTRHIDPAAWSPLIYNFRHYHGLAPEVGHGFRSETARTTV